jgi:nucleotide-binding universal stress UspA family protein
MAHNRIAVGFDGSPAARRALAWAVRKAVQRDALVLVVTAWTVTDHRPEALMAERIRLGEEQRAAIAEARAPYPPSIRPVVARELILADPVTALAHVARMVDTVVLGDAAPAVPGTVSLADRLGQRLRSLRRRRGDSPLIVVIDQPDVPVRVPRRELAAVGR